MENIIQLSVMYDELVQGKEVDNIIPKLRETDAYTNQEIRLLLKIYSSVIYSLWEKSNFGAEEYPDKALLKFMYEKALCFMSKTDLRQGEWFGGKTRFGHAVLRDRVFVTLLIAASVFKDEQICVTVEQKFSEHFSSTKDLVCCFLHQDDNCIALGICLLILKDFYKNSRILHCYSAVIYILMGISFESNTILDWFKSELSSISFICRLLDDISRNEENINEWDKVAKRIHEGNRVEVESKRSENQKKGRWHYNTVTCSNDIIINLGEIKNAKYESHNFRVQISEPEKLWVPDPGYDLLNYCDSEFNDLFLKIFLTFLALSEKLAEMQLSQSTPFNPKRIIHLIDRLRENIEKLHR